MTMSLTTHNQITFLTLDNPDAKVNILTSTALHELDRALDMVAKDKSCKALVIQSAKPGIFIAGADIQEIQSITTTTQGQQMAKAGQDIFNKLEDLPTITVAILDGMALGGGCELALACHYRLGTFNPQLKIGLPEVNLGFVPGFGGTYRLPRLVGLTESLKMIMSGKPVNATKALRIGLLDALVPNVYLEAEVYKFVTSLFDKKICKKIQNSRLKKRHSFLNNSLSGNFLVFKQSKSATLKLTKGFYPAPLNALALIRKTLYERSRTKALKQEAKVFADLALTEVSRNCVRTFFLSEQYKKLRLPEEKDLPPTDIQHTAVIGAGVMGGGIAQLLSAHDYWVLLKDLQPQALGHGLKTAQDLYQQAVKKRRLKPAQAQMKMGHITPTLDFCGFKNVDVVIEAVVEDLSIKEKVFKELSAQVSPQTIIATNTSALSIAAMARQTMDPSQVIGIHFFNPVHRMPLVEIITSEYTSAMTTARTLNFVKKLRKIPILVKDSPGFLVNRILLAYLNEAGRLLEETHDIKGIDALMRDFGMPMGPFQLCDEVGIDVGIKVLQILEAGINKHFKPVKIFDQIYAKKFFGKKVGQGFYRYAYEAETNVEVARLLKGFKARYDKEEAKERLIYLMINEASKCMAEGLIDHASTVDAGMIFGTGFPAFRGGLLRYADHVGLTLIVDRLKTFADQFKTERFVPSPYLVNLAKNNTSFYER